MGIHKDARKWLETQFRTCITYQLELQEHEAVPTVAVVDLMQWVHSVENGGIPLVRCLQYFADRIKNIMHARGTTIRTCIVLVDGPTLPAKKLVCHKKRYGNKSVYEDHTGPHLPVDGAQCVPSEWNDFAGNQKLLRRELYPRLFNMFMSCRFFTPNPGQNLILSGFPGRSHYQTMPVPAPWESFVADGGRVWQIRYWDEERELPITEAMEQADPDLYHRAYMVQNVIPCAEYPQGGLLRAEWTQGKCALSEADVRMFWFDHFFQTEHIIFYCNDGDVFPIGGLYARERCIAAPSFRTNGGDDVIKRGTYQFRNRHTVCLPYKRKDLETDPTKGPQQFWNLNKFYALVCEYPPFRAHGVANPMAMVAFLITLSGTDYMKKFLHGMGETTIIYPTFMENLGLLRHLVQVNDVAGLGQTRRARAVIIDEDLFKTFVRFCYSAQAVRTRNGKSFKDDKVRSLSFAQLKSKTKALPSPNETRLRCRQIQYTLELWRNGPMGFEPDIYQQWFGMPYFPYARDPVTGKPMLTEAVAPQSRCTDEAFAHNLYRVRVEGKQLYREPATTTEEPDV